MSAASLSRIAGSHSLSSKGISAPAKVRPHHPVWRWSWMTLFALSLGLMVTTQANAGDHGRHRGHYQQHHYSGHGRSERRHRRHNAYAYRGDHGYRRDHRQHRRHDGYRRHHDYGHRRHAYRGGHGYYGPYRRDYGHHRHHRHDSAYVLGSLLPLIAYGHYYD